MAEICFSLVIWAILVILSTRFGLSKTEPPPDYDNALRLIEGYTLRAENALRSTEQYCEDADKNAKHLILMARHWALTAGAPKEEVLDTSHWVSGEIIRRVGIKESG